MTYFRYPTRKTLVYMFIISLGALLNCSAEALDKRTEDLPPISISSSNLISLLNEIRELAQVSSQSSYLHEKVTVSGENRTKELSLPITVDDLQRLSFDVDNFQYTMWKDDGVTRSIDLDYGALRNTLTVESTTESNVDHISSFIIERTNKYYNFFQVHGSLLYWLLLL